MRATGKMRKCRAALLAGGAALVLVAAGCGSEDFANAPRPPVTVDLSGRITDEDVSISPRSTGAGPVLITLSNQTGRALTVTLEGEDVIERVGPVQPQDTVPIEKTLEPGSYEIRAGSSRAVDIEDQIAPATLEIGPERESSGSDVLLP
jgi:hypothetical protein